MKNISLLSILAIGTLSAGMAVAQENYATNWSGHKNVVLNTTGTGAAVYKNVTNFPVLIRLDSTSAAVFAASKSKGADIRFTKANNTTRLPHQIETWDSAGRTAAVWVRVDTVYGNRNNQTLRMHWGNTAADDSSKGSAVFDTASGFRAVWHMNDTGNVADASARGLTAVANGSPAAATGMIGGARSFNGSSSYFNVPGSDSMLNFAANTNYSVSAWVNAAQIVSHGTVLSKGDYAYALKLQSGATWEFFEYNDGWNAATAFTTAEAGFWVHVLGVQEGASTALYFNGVRENPDVALTSDGTGRNETINVNIGREPQATGGRRYFNGVIDEVRVHGVSRSANWARLEYQNQRLSQTLVTLLDTIPTLDTTSAPGAATAVIATAGTTAGLATISWTAPSSTGGSPITGYTAMAVNDSSKFCTSTGATSCSIFGLTVDSTYTFTVRASNLVGTGPASSPSDSLTIPVSLRSALLIQMAGNRNPFVFRLPSGISENVESLSLSIVDVWGRTVWSRTVNPSRENISQIAWNGTTSTGKQAASGMYLVRAQYTERGQTIRHNLKGVTLAPR